MSKVKNNPIQEFLTQLRISFLGDNLMHKYDNEKPPIRAELFSLEQMEAFARTLAESHQITEERTPEQLLKRLADNEEILLEVYALLTESAKENSRITPAGEWLLDNFYLIEEQIYTGKKHLPKGYSKGLPQLSKGPSAGYPRVYDIALELIAHSDGRVDLRGLSSFTAAYQEIAELKLGELWAIPIMLRLALIENLRRLAAHIAKDRINKNLADYWADQMTETAEKDPKSLILVIADMARYGPPMESSFVAELTRRLVGKGAAFSLPLSWIEQRLSEKGMTSDELVHQENQKQAADQVSISNSIGSLRFLSTNNWRDFIEAISPVEKILQQDADGIYTTMDFRTRDEYRHVVEKIAKSSNQTETFIAQRAIQLASHAPELKPQEADRAGHVGYYLIGEGRKELEKNCGVRLTVKEKIYRAGKKVPLLIYVGSSLLMAIVFSGSLIKKAYEDGVQNPWLLGGLTLLALIATSQLAISLINWLVTLLVQPMVMPRMDFSDGVPEKFKTLIVIPSMFNDQKELDGLLENLEVRFLANRDNNLHFALLTDFKDAKTETLPGEDLLLSTAVREIEALNYKYGKDKNELFFLFHRPRKYNVKDRIWMGYERKRGKLGEMNGLLRGHGRENFSAIIADESVYLKVKYVITLDTDTQLPRDAAWKITGTMAHPLNHAVYNEKKQRITEGYGILQPRVVVSLPYGNCSLFSRMHGNEPGIDPYTRAISDVYQDLFSEGSFIGKGIYDIDAFEKTMKNRFPENRILSHDLLEGNYARSGLLSDVQLYEAYPERYEVDMKRRHRWVRGDWQIASWILPFVPNAQRKLVKNPVSALSRWKIFDNLRRSLVPIALFVLFLFGWIFSPSPMFWTVSLFVILLLPITIQFFYEIWRKPDDIKIVHHAMLSLLSASYGFFQQVLTVLTLPYEAGMNVDAIFRTNWRMIISRRKLLQWNPSVNLINSRNTSLLSSFAGMWFSPLVAIGLFYYLSNYTPTTLVSALPFLIGWFIVPAVVWRISLPGKPRKADLSAEQKGFLYKLSRKTWAFFETFVVEGDNWLPPDNYQESPVERIAHRTSPTNIGLSLLANLSALDFGYIFPGTMLDRCSNTFQTMEKMEQYEGHLYNWYDTQSLVPLSPKYISTVDSGNMVGHLLVLKQGLMGVVEEDIIPRRFYRAIGDTVNIVKEKASNPAAIQPFEALLETYLISSTASLSTHHKNIRSLLEAADGLTTAGEPGTDTNWWTGLLKNQLQLGLADLQTMAPWLLLDAVPEKFSVITAMIDQVPTLKALAGIEMVLLPEINKYAEESPSAAESSWLKDFRRQAMEAGRRAKERMLTIQAMVRQCDAFSDIKFDFLFDKSQRLLSIGYNVVEHRRDNSFYDLLASESRLTTFIGIAQGKLTQDSWFALGRQLTNPGTLPVLLSWSGSMFEYLMPSLVMPSFENTLLDQTNKAAVQKQIDYGKKRGVPWGVSESGYNMVDANLNYQYKAFGVPGLGLKRGLGEDLVIAPYATVMSLMVAPEESVKNLEQLVEDGFEGKYGMYEAVDYTTSRLSRGQTFSIVKSFMVHHQGMSFLSLAYLLLDQPMQKRFENEAQFRAIMLLLQERVPHVTEFYSPSVHVSDSSITTAEVQMRVIKSPSTPVPEVQLLSNGRYHVMVTNAGTGYSRWRDMSVTRWKEDITLDDKGIFCYVRDLDNDGSWSAAFQPSLQAAESYEVVFSQGRAEFRRQDQNLETYTEIVVSSEDDVEMRRVRVTNRSRKKRYIEITSYAEVVLASAAADAAHPAFSNLFVQTEILPQRDAILCTRRPRAADDNPPWMFHLMKVDGAEIRDISYETDRSLFTGRTNSIHDPAVMSSGNRLSGSQGAVLDPVVAIRYRFVIDAHDAVTVDMVYGMADTREACNGLIEKYQDRHLTDRAFELAWTHSQVVLRQINATEADAQLYAKLASAVIFANASLRTDPAVIIRNRRGQSGLWSYSISGDLPIVLLQIQDSANIDLARQLVQAHAYWRLKGLMVDLVIWNDDFGGYRAALQSELLSLISPGIISDVRDKPGGVFVRSGEQVSAEDRILFQTVARIVISDTLGTLEEQIARRNKVRPVIPYFTPTKFYASINASLQAPKDLLFWNGLGGFSKDGKEYVIFTGNEQVTPAPWVNVIANPVFGTVLSESGQSYSWMDNAHEFRLTPWSNDAVSDTSGEVFYIRDEESGKYWSPALLPNRGKSGYITRHGFGYSIFEYLEDGIGSTMTIFVDETEPVKFTSIRIRNDSGRSRKLSVTGYIEWVLGDLRSKSLMHTVTELNQDSSAVFASNAYSSEFNNYVGFFDVDDATRTFTCDRTEFLGRNGSYKNPEGMNKSKLSGRIGAAMDACTVLQSVIDLADGEEKELVFRLGAGRDMYSAVQTAKKCKGTVLAAESLVKVKKYWEEILSAVRIETPDPAINLLTNGWLNYQTLSSRIWGRSGFYQSGGAFGFRDQLQDSLSLLHNRPDLVRQQILLSASRQFKEGDVQHWWHPPAGRGVRTTCSDDYLWLPFVTSRYVAHTGDETILQEQVKFLEGRLLNPGEESNYDLPVISQDSSTLYDHCVRSIRHGLRFGVNGIPLMGTGDWNDGMDRVGFHGKGESVWLAFFLYDVLLQFADITKIQHDTAFADQCTIELKKLKDNIEKNCWDGEWYRRAYFDDGTPLGSSVNEECKIDSIPQSWSVISGGGDTARSKQAMESAYEHLVKQSIGVIQLFDPPFDHSSLNPGYIKGYLPGVRENGGQYTHAAVWLVMAFAQLKNREKTWELIKLINPVNHGGTPAGILRYKTEPYVIAADVYAVADHQGRGGWTWYTGSAGWMYQLVVESFLGIKRKGNILRIDPCVPADWKSFAVHYRYLQTTYHITCVQESGLAGIEITLDKIVQTGDHLHLLNDQTAHEITVRIPVGQVVPAVRPVPSLV